ncbi:hypothetical protein LQF12_03600 [Ruania suaedae]|uniref:hypothetical protein n=1 Tax=Ruania suaedae TaxID=2897774 RepID=UPI001E39A3D7|nr:hypothetical protein [Ruania suaedae]UFU03704.1 hypothetical protein LQF12_03600 [Ruania suaedae]
MSAMSPTGGRLRTPRLLVLVAVLALVALGWQVTREARVNWWPTGPHEAIGPGEDFAGVQVELVGLEPAGRVTEWDTPWSPPEGFEAWRTSLAVTTTQEELVSMEVLVETADGRQFAAGEHVPFSADGYEWSLSVAVPEEGEDPIPEVQHLLVLLPADAEPAAVRIETTLLYPQYVRLPVAQ